MRRILALAIEIVIELFESHQKTDPITTSLYYDASTHLVTLLGFYERDLVYVCTRL